MHHEVHEEREGVIRGVGIFILRVLRVLCGGYQTRKKNKPRRVRRKPNDEIGA